MPKNIIVAIDGPGGSGKSTVARSVARRLGYTYIDTGAMYRAVALWAIRLGMDLDDLHKMDHLAQAARIEFAGEGVMLNGEDVSTAIREPQVADAASKIATYPGVRRAMREEQRRMGFILSAAAGSKEPYSPQVAGWARASFVSTSTSSSNAAHSGSQVAAAMQCAFSGTAPSFEAPVDGPSSSSGGSVIVGGG